ncbi:glycosyltransferase family 4 protein, partial [Candidatus Woesearchaeota archaeon]|nr:glycosyltransferase family 4 protein [Candidatus Woesearchaeota archaeon]
MKILFICENYYPHRGGAEVLFKKLAESYVKRGHSVTVLTHRLRGTRAREEIGGVQIERVDSAHSRYGFTFSSICKAITLARTHDIIQTTLFNGAPPAWVAAKIAKKPVVLTVHEVWAGKWKEITGFSVIKSAVHNFLERSIYRLPFDHYICVSEETKKDLLKQQISPQKVRRIYNGLDYAFWNRKMTKKKEIQNLRERLGVT